MESSEQSFWVAAPKIQVCDVGALCHGLGTEPYHRLIERGLASVVGFEPNAEEAERAQATLGAAHEILPCFIGDGSRRRFYQCNAAMTSSLYEPNIELQEMFQSLAKFSRVEDIHWVQTRRLDEIDSVADTDFLKMDVQGAELDVIAGATETLRAVTVVQTEVMFEPLYLDQPLFADIDQALRARGFRLHKLIDLSGRAFKPLMVRDASTASLGQLLWGDAVYVRDFMRLADLSPPKLIRMAIVLDVVYGAYDLAHLAILEHDRKVAPDGTALAGPYLQRILSADTGSDASEAPKVAGR